MMEMGLDMLDLVGLDLLGLDLLDLVGYGVVDENVSMLEMGR